MTDIVERLRLVQGDNEDAREAADEIERLTAERDVWKIACNAQADEVKQLRAENEYLRRWKEAEEKKQRNRKP